MNLFWTAEAKLTKMLKTFKSFKSKHVKNQFKATFKIPTLQNGLKVTDECQWWVNN